MATGEQVKAILDKALKCDKKIEVRQAAHIFIGVLEMLTGDDRTVFGGIKEELGNRAINGIVMTLVGSYIGSLYGSATCKDEEAIKDFAKKEGVDEVKISGQDENLDLNEKPSQA